MSVVPTTMPTATPEVSQTNAGGDTPLPLADRLSIMMSLIGGNTNEPTLTTGGNSAVADGQPNLTTTAVGTPSAASGVAAESLQSSLTNEAAQKAAQNQSINQAADAASQNSVATSSGPVSNAGNPQAKNAQANQQLGQQMAAQMGWTGDQWAALNNVIMSESGWTDAANPNSSARGIGQNIHGYSNDYQQGNISQQIQWTLNYIKNRYGSPAAAWQHKIATRGDQGNTGGWY